MVGSRSLGGDFLQTSQFTGVNYDFWAVKIKTILIVYDLWDVVEVSILPQPQLNPELVDEFAGEGSETEHIPGEAPTISRENKIKNIKALSLIQIALSDELFPRIRNGKTTKGAWDVMRREFRRDKKARVVKLQAVRTYYIRMIDGESLDNYLAKFFETVNNLKSLG